MLANIKYIEIDEIDIGGLVYEGVYTPTYPEPCATQQKEEGIDLKVLPIFRPDKTLALDDPNLWNEYIDKLADAAAMNIENYNDLIAAV